MIDWPSEGGTRATRILLLSFYFRPDLSPGSFRAAALADALVERGAQVDVLSAMPNRYASHHVDAPALEEAPGISVRRFAVPAHDGGMRSQAIMYRHFARAALKAAKSAEADIVVVTTGRMFTATLASVIARRLKLPLYIDVRDIFVDTIQDILPRAVFTALSPVLRAIESFTFGRATRLNLVSPGFVPYFQRRFPHIPYEVRTNGIDALFNAPPAATAHPCGGPALEVVYAGNVGEGQGLHHILPEAARALGGAVRFRVIGDGGRIRQLREACVAAGVDNVEITPPVDRQRLAEIYADADALLVHLNAHRAFEKVLPSKLFEYGATGRPILAGVGGTAAAFIRKDLPDAALFDPLDVAGLVAAIRRLEPGAPSLDRTQFIADFDRTAISRRMADSITATAIAGLQPGGFGKRAFDLALALPLAVIALPIVAIAAVAVRLETTGAPIFLQPRVGRGGRVFRIVKLRTMVANTEHRASHHVSRSAITRLGAVLRRFKIDELPQLANVIAGDMSLVGPRPCLPVQQELIDERRQHGVDRLKPGITGVSQVRGLDMSAPRALAISDAVYHGRWSIRLDLAILWRTVSGGGMGDAAKGLVAHEE